ncbi:MAG TPA: 4-alpha-glucanotransferase [Candidatus Dietzia intestinigallinarum]|nr:4-alpha-glucanotransferase [Candidatus Dietzia intestinigallinarum]
MTAIAAVPPALAELAEACGVATGYTDAHGVHHDVPEHTLRAVLASMGVGVGRDDADGDSRTADDRAALEDARLRPWRQLLPPTVVARRGTPTSVSLHIPRGATVSVTAHLEDGGEPIVLVPLRGPRVQRRVDGVTMEQVPMSVPGDLPTGWHRLVVVVDHVALPTGRTATGRTAAGRTDSARTVESTLIVAPATIPLPAGLDERPATGLAAQLYQLRSRDSWGVGDFADLGTLAEWGASGPGADFVLINPVHCGEPFPPVSPSPYLPTSRRFVSPLYLRPELVPEYADLHPADRARVDELARDAAGMNDDDDIDRNRSWTAKLEALRVLFSVRPTPERADAFGEFVDGEGPGLHAFATWCAIAGEHGSDWTRWPVALRDPDSPDVARFVRQHRDEVRFHQWLQWITVEQRADAQRRALEAGMRLGVVHDLAVGVHPTGADAWSLSGSLARGVSVGAPPDVYNQRGQDWSQPPLRPDALAESGYRPFREIVRAALRGAGGIRVDHILGLFRLWWIPEGCPPTEGTYVRYDAEAMLAVLSLEAARAGAVVIGEDLGTVAPGVREMLTERGVLGTSVMWFENRGGVPVDPEEYRALCMASVTTHDLVPTAGYAELVQVDIRERLGQLARDVEVERSAAASEVAAFVACVRDRGLLEGDSPLDLVAAFYAFTAASPSVLLAVSVADLVADRRPVNVPGTSVEYPNWSVPVADGAGRVVGLESLMASSGAGRVFAAIDAARGDLFGV